ncbi:MAG: hypothetical protein U1E59_05440 [Amaricoccus sp.]
MDAKRRVEPERQREIRPFRARLGDRGDHRQPDRDDEVMGRVVGVDPLAEDQPLAALRGEAGDRLVDRSARRRRPIGPHKGYARHRVLAPGRGTGGGDTLAKFVDRWHGCPFLPSQMAH